MTRLAALSKLWGETADRAQAAVPDSAVEALWRALNYLSAGQLYLAANVRLDHPLQLAHVKQQPRGHWGVCPPVNAMLAQLAPLVANRLPGTDLVVLHGAGHAGPSALAYAYLSGALRIDGSARAWSWRALTRLVTEFPNPETFGSEITPLIPGVRYTGGQLGPALAVAQGMALDAPTRLVVPLIGDGECETGATAAAWLARRALVGTGEHGAVLPVVLLNGLRMGGPSLLAGMHPSDLEAYLVGLGYQPFISDGSDPAALRQTTRAALHSLQPLDADGTQPMIVLTMPKGATGPTSIGGRMIMGTPRVHKTPLSDPYRDSEEFAELKSWLGSYRPLELFTSAGAPTTLVCQALPTHPEPSAAAASSPSVRRATRTTDVSAAIRGRAAAGGFRLFSPDELTSNRLILAQDGFIPPWVVEILNEELCHAWSQGYTESGRDALLATYEAFAPINISLLAQQLKHRRLQRALRTPMPSINYLVTSLGWRNTYTHQYPGLTGALLDMSDPTVHIYCPADRVRAGTTLAGMLRSKNQTNVLVADKHSGIEHPTSTINAELANGLAVWPHLSHAGRPHIILASAGDIAAEQLSVAVKSLRRTHQQLRVRYLHVHDLTVLGSPVVRSAGLDRATFTGLFSPGVPVLIATTGLASSIHALLGERTDNNNDRFNVVGYRDPGRPTSPAALLRHTGMAAEDLTRHALALVKGGHP
ncbi:hypothetical protein ABZ780_05205 [Micromonospora sp. NPDC047467]|uniref:phosphoketolase family protein n=1 Tax=Micromonospora sp. NPDC047467 TaxID=3154814 RepID=UPI0033F0BF16